MHRSPMPRVLTTDAVAARERLAYWNDAVSDAYVRLDTTAPGGDVVGDIRVDALATLELSRVTATAQLVRRTPSLIATAAEDFFLVSIQTRGTGLVTQDGARRSCSRATSRSTTPPGPTSCGSTAPSSSTCSCCRARRCARSCAALRS